MEGHEAIIADSDDFMLVRPDEAYHRQNMQWGHGQLTDSDRKQIGLYKSEMLKFNKSAAYVSWVWFKSCEDELGTEMLQLIPYCKTINTRANWEAVQAAMIEH